MLQSSNNGNDPIYYSDQQGYNRPFFNDISMPNSKHDHQEQPPPPLTPLSFFHLPSPCIPYDYLELQDYDIFLHQNHDLFLHHHHHQQQQQPQSLTRSFASDTMVDFNINEDATNYKKSQHNNNNNTSLDHDQDQQRKQMMMTMPKKRSSKRDRHSKINTAQGPRDRRMRLSLKVAREFFDLQDKLCFDKASKTVEWLLVQSRQAIKKLSAGGGGGDGGLLPPNNYSCTSTLPTKSASSTSECEVVSGIDEAAATKASISKTTKPSSSSCVNNKGIKRAKPSRRTALFHPLARESREKARARARERTKEKHNQKIMDESKLCEESRNQELNQLSCWSSPFENTTTGDQESGNNNNTMNPCLDMQLPIGSSPERDRLVLATTSDNMGKWSPSSTINHLYNTGIPQEHPITDLQSLYMQFMGGL